MNNELTAARHNVNNALKNYDRALELALELSEEFDLYWQGIDHGGHYNGVVEYVLKQLAERARATAITVDESLRRFKATRAAQARWFLHSKHFWITLENKNDELVPLFVKAGQRLEIGPGWGEAVEILLTQGYYDATEIVTFIVEGLKDGSLPKDINYDD